MQELATEKNSIARYILVICLCREETVMTH